MVAGVYGVQNEKERETAQMILDSLIKWSIECTQVNQTAHIVFVADNAFTTDILSRSTCGSVALRLYRGASAAERR